jgi:glycerate 2-kinase
LDEIIDKILQYSDPYNTLKEEVTIINNKIYIKNYEFKFEKPLLISVGKASYKMSKFFLERIKPVRSILVKPKNSPKIHLDNTEIFETSHPLPDESSIMAAEVIVDTIKREDYDLLIFLISGGSSAMIELSEIPLDELRYIYDILIKSGLSINEINIVRKHLSLIKGGQLGKNAKSPILTLAVSDVPDNDISSIGSGPTVIDNSTINDAREIMRRLGLNKWEKYLRETPKSLPNSVSFIILDNMRVLKKLSRNFKNSLILSSEIRGDAVSLGMFFASIFNSIERYGENIKRPYTILAGGEPEVKIDGKGGKGGRNGEVVLGFLKWGD